MQGPERIIGRFPIKSKKEGVRIRGTLKELLVIKHPFMLFALSMRNTNFPGDGVGRFDIDAMCKIESVHEAAPNKSFCDHQDRSPLEIINIMFLFKGLVIVYLSKRSPDNF